MENPVREIAIVTPVFNDWPSFARLVHEIESAVRGITARFHIIAVDDGSSQALEGQIGADGDFKQIRSIEIVRLVCNLGHQRAIAVGLVLAAARPTTDAVIVMDSDGEDRPEDVPRLLTLGTELPGRIICAQRAKRSEGLVFRSFYSVYKLFFRLLTGITIDFGNFCMIPRPALDSIVYNAGIWNNLAATVVRSRIPIGRLGTSRGTRYAGRSHMNLISLILHGMSALSVYSDTALVRLLLLMLSLSMVTVAAALIVLIIRFTTHLAIPGWTSNVVGSLSILFTQSVVFSAIAAFLLLSARSTTSIIPALELERYVLRRKQVFAR